MLSSNDTSDIRSGRRQEKTDIPQNRRTKYIHFLAINSGINGRVNSHRLCFIFTSYLAANRIVFNRKAAKECILHC